MASDYPAQRDVVSVKRESPKEIFGLLSNEVRVEILRVLNETAGRTSSFSSLFDQVDVADSGNFNYHLSRLIGSFVQKKEYDGTAVYELTHAGRQVVGAFHAGTYTAGATIEPISVGWNCGLCGGDFRVSYEDERAKFLCEDCSKGAIFPFPPGSLEGFPPEDLPEVFARWWHSWVTRITNRFCPACAGRLDGELRSLPKGPPNDPSPAEASFSCQCCGAGVSLSGSTVATMHPMVEGFLSEHGFDVTTRHASQTWGELDLWETTIRSKDPIKLTYTFGHEGDVIIVDIDSDATVTNAERK